MTIASLLIVFYLVWGEWSDYRRVTVHPELIVDKGRGDSPIISLDAKQQLTAICQANEWKYTSTSPSRAYPANS